MLITIGFWVFFVPFVVSLSTMLTVVRPWAGPMGPQAARESPPQRWPGLGLALGVALSVWGVTDHLLTGALSARIAQVALGVAVIASLASYGQGNRVARWIVRAVTSAGVGALVVVPLTPAQGWSIPMAVLRGAVIAAVGLGLWASIESAGRREERSSVVLSLLLVAIATSLALLFGDSAVLARTAGALPAGIAGVLLVVLIAPKQRQLTSLWAVSALTITASLAVGVLYAGTSIWAAALIVLAAVAIWSPAAVGRFNQRLRVLRAVRIILVALLVATGVGYQAMGYMNGATGQEDTVDGEEEHTSP